MALVALPLKSPSPALPISMTLTLDRRGASFPSLGPHTHLSTYSSNTSDPDRSTVNSANAHLTDLCSVLDQHISCTEISPTDHQKDTSRSVMPLHRTQYDFPGVDDQSRDLHSDLFLLDQAMQAQNNPTSMPVSDLDGTDALFGEALNRPTPAICPNLFEDMVGHSKLLSLENAPEATLTNQYGNQRLSHQQNHSSLSANPSVLLKSNETGSSMQESSDLECILQELGIISSQSDRDSCYTKEHSLRSMPNDVPRPFKDPLGHDIHPSGHMAFGKQKKRRLSSISSEPHVLIGDTAGHSQMAKRAKTTMHYSTGMHFSGPSKSIYRPSPFRKETRSYSLLSGGTSGLLSSAGGSAGGVNERTDSARPHPDLYENLSPELQARVDHLREKIGKMPRRKLRESLAKGVSIEEVEPLMSVNRDDLAEMLGLGVTTWKIFIHHTFGIPRWPARVLKSQEMREKSLRGRLQEAEDRGNTQEAADLYNELKKLQEKRRNGRNTIRAMARKCREKLMSGTGKGQAK